MIGAEQTVQMCEGDSSTTIGQWSQAQRSEYTEEGNGTAQREATETERETQAEETMTEGTAGVQPMLCEGSSSTVAGQRNETRQEERTAGTTRAAQHRGMEMETGAEDIRRNEQTEEGATARSMEATTYGKEVGGNTNSQERGPRTPTNEWGRGVKRQRKQVERLGMIDTTARKKQRATTTTPKGGRIVRMERMGAAAGELRYLIRLGPAIMRRMEEDIEDGEKEDG